MPNEILVITAYQRPEFLHWTLGKLREAHKPDNLVTTVWVDNHLDGACADGIMGVISANGIRYVKCPAHDHVGNTHMVMAAIKEALEGGAELIHVLEEDILVAPDYFRWHEAAHALGRYPLTVASNRHGYAAVSSYADPGTVFESPSPTTVGVCFSRWFAEMLMEHNTPDYWHDWANMHDYLGRKFPERDGYDDMQWDGLIRRMFVKHGFKCLYPLKPRAYHFGWVGANRRTVYRFQDDSLEDKIRETGEIIFSNARLQEVSGYMQDCRVYDLFESKWERLVVV